MIDQKVSYPAAMPTTIRALSHILSVVAAMPKALPTQQAPTVRPLKIGVAADLHSRIVLPEGMRQGKANGIVADALRLYAASPEYLKAVATPGAWRVDLDGNPVEPVSQEHAEHARAALAAPVTPLSPSRETITVQISALKVTVVLTPDQLPPIAETLKTLDLRLDLGDGRPINVSFSGKSYRRTRRQVDDLLGQGQEVVIVMQGRLVAGGRIEQAGLAVQTRTPRETSAEGGTS